MDVALPRVRHAADGARPSVSVIVCAYTDRRWGLLVEAIESIRRQSEPPEQLVLVIDHNPQLLERARETFPAAHVVPNEDTQGLSGARNTGVRHCTGDVLVFLDDDAAGHPDWLATLLDPFSDPLVMGAGGAALPAWDGAPPRWMPPEFWWVVGASYVGLPRQPGPIRNPIGANMAFRSEAFARAGAFTEGIGRVGRTPLGCEETEFSIRLRQTVPGAIILYLPAARVDHHVPSDRTTWSYFTSRCWAEGVSKALVTGLVGDRDGLSSERAYVVRALGAGVVRGVRDAVRGDPAGLARAGMIVVGLGCTTAGFARGRAAARVRGRRSREVVRPEV
jgi:glycosyltransferase involved in cell wall biosynthesis